MNKKIFVILTICFGVIAALFAFLGFTWDNSWIVMLIFGILIGITWIVYAILKKKGKIESASYTKIINGITDNFNWIFNVEDNPNSFAEKQFKSSNAFHKFIIELERSMATAQNDSDITMCFLSCRKVLEWLLNYVRHTDDILKKEFYYFINTPNGKYELTINGKLNQKELKQVYEWKLISSSNNKFTYVTECHGKKIDLILTKQLTNTKYRLIEQQLSGKPLIKKWQNVHNNDKKIVHCCQFANELWSICSDALHYESNFEYKWNKHFRQLNINRNMSQGQRKFSLLINEVYNLRDLMYNIACIYCQYSQELPELKTIYYGVN